jgi:uncharacterized repeat protein (TIGR01451 family)
MAGPATVAPGGQAIYTLTVTNNGPDTATTVALTDKLPGGLRLAGETQLSGPDAFVNNSNPATNTVTFNAAAVPAGNTDVFQVVATAAFIEATAVALNNTATVSSATADPNPANNTSTVTTVVAPGPPASPPPATVTITNVSDRFTPFGQNETLTAHVTAAGGQAVNQGSVTFHDGGMSQTVQVSNGTATATFKFPLLQEFSTALQHTVTADSSDAGGFFASSSASLKASGNFFGLLLQLEFDQALLQMFQGNSG